MLVGVLGHRLVRALLMTLALAVSIALVVHLHGRAEELGAWRRGLEWAAVGAVALQIATLGAHLVRRTGVHLPGRAIFIALTLTWASGCLHPYRETASLYSLVIALGALSALALFGPWLSARRVRPLLRALDVLAMNLCLLIVAAEVALGLLAHVVSSPLLAVRVGDAAAELRARRTQPGLVSFGSRFNSHGWNDRELAPKAPGGCLIAAIGDSFSTGIVPQEFHFTTVAEGILGCEVANIGFPSIGPEEYLLLLKDEAAPLHPDVIIIDIFVGNDVVDNLVPHNHLRDLLQTWLDRDALRFYQVPRRLAMLVRESRRQGRQLRAVAAQDEGTIKPISGRAALEQAFPWLGDPMKETPTYSTQTFREIEAVHATAMCSGISSEDAAYARLDELLGEMRAAAAPARLGVMVIPDELQVEDAVWKDLQLETLERDRPQRLLREHLAALGIPMLDVLPDLRSLEPLADGRRHVYQLRDTHFNARGNQVTGQALARFVRELRAWMK
jgi:hypothetical protein